MTTKLTPAGEALPNEIFVDLRGEGLGRVRTYYHQQLPDTVKYVPASILELVREALETPSKMVDADLMFCLSDFNDWPHETVKQIALATCRLIGNRNEKALAAITGPPHPATENTVEGEKG